MVILLAVTASNGQDGMALIVCLGCALFFLWGAYKAAQAFNSIPGLAKAILLTSILMVVGLWLASYVH